MQLKKSLEKKLTTTSMGTLATVSIVMLVVVMVFQFRAGQKSLSAIEAQIKDRLDEKGELLVVNHALALKGLVEENAVSDIRELVNRTVLKDSEIVYGVFLEYDMTPFAISRQGDDKESKFSEKEIVKTLKLDESVIEKETKGEFNRHLTIGNEEISEFAAHIMIDEEDAGSIRYGISMEPMRLAVEEARAESKTAMLWNFGVMGLVGLVAMIFGFIVTQKQSREITKPLSVLTNAANAIAAGDNSVKVEITSGDEIEILASSFNKMVSDLATSYEDVAKKNAELAQAHGDLEELNKGLEEKVANRTVQLRQKNQDIDNMLQSMNQGIFTILTDLSVHHEYSKHLEIVLEDTDVAGRSSIDLLFKDSDLGSDAIDGARVTLLNSVGAHRINLDMNRHLLPTEFVKTVPSGTTKVLEVDWNGIIDDAKNVNKVMVTLRDVTELRELQAGMDRQKRQLEIIGQILAVSPNAYEIFMSSSEQFMERNRKLISENLVKREEVVAELFRNMHTIKGNARTHHFVSINDTFHEAEDYIKDLRDSDESDWDVEKLIEIHDLADAALGEFGEVFNEKLAGLRTTEGGSDEELVAFAKEMKDLIKQLGDGALSIETFTSDANRLIFQTSSLKLKEVLTSAISGMENLARDLAKPVPSVVLNAPGVVIPRDTAPVLQNVFVHVFRNAVDHGLEDAQERVKVGKRVEGTVVVEAIENSEDVVFTVYDDGRGLNMASLREKAATLGLETGADDQSLAELIFASGVSTATELTDVSGRGVGMDAVKAFLEDINGSAEVVLLEHAENSGDYRPCKFIFTIPNEADMAELS